MSRELKPSIQCSLLCKEERLCYGIRTARPSSSAETVNQSDKAKRSKKSNASPTCRSGESSKYPLPLSRALSLAAKRGVPNQKLDARISGLRKLSFSLSHSRVHNKSTWRRCTRIRQEGEKFDFVLGVSSRRFRRSLN